MAVADQEQVKPALTAPPPSPGAAACGGLARISYSRQSEPPPWNWKLESAIVAR